MPVTDAIRTVLSRNDFYRDAYRRLLRVCIIQAVIIIVLIGTLTAVVMTKNIRHVFFATTSDGRIINVVPLSSPLLGDEQIKQWAAKTVTGVMQMGYHDFRQRMQDVAVNFTQTGWTNFTQALQQARVLEAIEKRSLVLTATVDAEPKIGDQGVVNGIYTWDVFMPITLTFQGEQALQPIKSVLKLQIVRVSTLQYPIGVGIQQWIQRDPNELKKQ